MFNIIRSHVLKRALISFTDDEDKMIRQGTSIALCGTLNMIEGIKIYFALRYRHRLNSIKHRGQTNDIYHTAMNCNGFDDDGGPAEPPLRDSHPSSHCRLRSKLRESKKGIGRIKWNARFKRKFINVIEYLLDVKDDMT